MKFLSLLLLLAPPAHSEPITVQGIEISAEVIDRFESGEPHKIRLQAPLTLAFARGNRFTVSGEVYLHATGAISLVAVAEKNNEVEWAMPNGKIAKLDCSLRRTNIGDMGRMVAFHKNLEYRSGCDAPYGVEFTDAAGTELKAFGSLEVGENFELVFASQVGSVRLKLGEESVALLLGTNINYHANGKVKFFTMQHGEVFTADQGELGTIKFTQKEGKHSSTTLFDDGKVQKGVLAQELIFAPLNLLIPKGSGIAFSRDGGKIEIADMILAAAQTVQLKGHIVVAARVFVEGTGFSLVTAEPFTFHVPSGQEIPVAAGFLVSFNHDLEITLIRGSR